MEIRLDIDPSEPIAMIDRAVKALSPPEITNAVRAASHIFLVGIRDRAPRLTGRLAASFYVSPVSAYEYEASSALNYAPVHEFGAIIVPRTRQFLRFEINGRVIFAKRVKIPARPYVLPTFVEDSDKAFAAFADYVEARL